MSEERPFNLPLVCPTSTSALKKKTSAKLQTASVLSSKIDAWLDGAPQISSDESGGGHTRAIIGP